MNTETLVKPKTTREHLKEQIDRLPDEALQMLDRFISFQWYCLAEDGGDEEETQYLLSIPGMKEKLIEGMNTPLSECVPLSEVWPDV